MNFKAEEKITNKKDEPLVSIITPVYNGVKYIEHTIQSVLNQSYSNIEYIIIDGGSTDGTVEVIKKYENKISYWVSEKDRGISDAFNKGIRAANGEIVGIINADDWYEPDVVELVVGNIHLADIIYGNLQYHDNEKESYVFSADHKLLNKEMTLNHPATFVKKSVYDRVGTYSLEFKCAMDYEFLMRCYVSHMKFLYLNKKFSNMRLQGVSDLNWTAGYREVKKVKDKYLGHPILNWIYFTRQVVVTGIGRAILKTGFSPVLDFYRKHFSSVKKVK